MRILIYSFLFLTMSLWLGCSKELTRSAAREQIEEYRAKHVSTPTTLITCSDRSVADDLIKSGYLEDFLGQKIENYEYVGVTSRGREIFGDKEFHQFHHSAWYFPLKKAPPVHHQVLDITDIEETKDASRRIVHFKEKYTTDLAGLPDALKRCDWNAEKESESTMRFRRYDDGWRIDSRP